MTTDTMTIDAAAVDAAIALNGKGSGNGYAPVTAKEWADLAAYPEDVAGVAGGLEAIAPAGAQGHAQEPAETLAELWARVGCHVLVRRRRAANLIPGESERPRFVVLDEPFKAPDGTKYRAGVWHFGSKPGRGDAPATLTQHLVCGPLHIDAVTFDGAGQNFGRLLRFKDTLGRWRNWAMPMEMLKGDGADLRGVLLAMGVYIDPSNAGRHWLAVYLQSQTPSRRMEAALQTGWAGQDFKAFALPDKGRVLFLPQPLLSISSTMVRERWLQGRRLDFLAPKAVQLLLREHERTIRALWNSFPQKVISS